MSRHCRQKARFRKKFTKLCMLNVPDSAVLNFIFWLWHTGLLPEGLLDTLICAGHWVPYSHSAIAGPTAHMGNSCCGTEQVIGENGIGSAVVPLLRCA